MLLRDHPLGDNTVICCVNLKTGSDLACAKPWWPLWFRDAVSFSLCQNVLESIEIFCLEVGTGAKECRGDACDSHVFTDGIIHF